MIKLRFEAFIAHIISEFSEWRLRNRIKELDKTLERWKKEDLINN
jgi:hypothetical protein